MAAQLLPLSFLKTGENKMRRNYVVFVGREPGIYSSLSDCLEQLRGFKDRKYISYTSIEEAEDAFKRYNDGTLYIGDVVRSVVKKDIRSGISIRSVYDEQIETWSASGSDITSGLELLSVDAMPFATKDLTEFLTVVAVLKYCKNRSRADNIYLDNVRILNWIHNKKVEYFIQKNQKNKELYTAILNAEKWLTDNEYVNNVSKVDLHELNDRFSEAC